MNALNTPYVPVTTDIAIEGMTCASCASRVEKALKTVPGVQNVSVNVARDSACLVSVAPVALVDVQAAIKQAGFQLAVHDITLIISGMSCASCAGRVEKALLAVKGVVSARVNLARDSASIQTLAGTDPQFLIRAVEAAGYKAVLPEAVQIPSPAMPVGLDPELRSVLFAMALTVPLMLPMLAGFIGVHIQLPGLAQLLLALPVQFWFGRKFYKAAWGALRAGTGNMDLLVALGTSAGFGLSIYQLIASGAEHATHYYFEASAVVITLVMLGKWLERRAKRQTASAINALQRLQPVMAWVREHGQERQLPIASVKPADLVVVKPGERVPVDGIVLEGQTHIDESMLTGESLPIAKDVGAKVSSGTINIDGLIVIQTQAVGSETALARIIRLVESAQAAKAPIQRLVDRVSAVFVPVVIALAACTFVGWWFYNADVQQAIINAVAVLVIACPCALGLATPTAIIAGTGVAAQQGILIQNAEVLEVAYRTTAVVFDKTGTLTLGTPSLTAQIPALNNEPFLALAASLQTASNHPLANAVLSAANDAALVIPHASQCKALPGRGISGEVNGRILQLGNTRLMEELNVDITVLRSQAAQLESQGNTVSWLAELATPNQLLGLLGFGDQIKPEAPLAVQHLHNLGIITLLLTGDNQGSADHVGSLVGIQKVIANVLPGDKARIVNELKSAGQVVAMVGDGINDAPALAAADVGIAMATGADIAMHTAGITLMRSNPALVADAIDISRRTYRKIQQNLFWAFIYNLIGIPLAAFGFLNPMLAGAAMAFSSVSVVSNALLLKRWRSAANIPIQSK
ncbi:MAG TPA: heavy metal translocating P-type ATPase [Cellvibrionaceae bacterium]